MNNPNFLTKFFKKLSKLINSLLEKNLNKLNINNLKKILISNKIFLTIVASIILFLSYLSLPNLYNQYEISTQLSAGSLKGTANLTVCLELLIKSKYSRVVPEWKNCNCSGIHARKSMNGLTINWGSS